MEEVKAHASILPTIRFYDREVKLRQVANRYVEGIPSAARSNLNIANVGRWKEMMAEGQIKLCRTLYGDFIRKMGCKE